MKLLYLDYNVYIGLMSNNYSIIEYTESLKDANYLSVYSPAHIEEVAVSTMRNNYPQDKTNEKLRFISDFNKDYELLPFYRRDTRVIYSDGIYLCEENPRICYSRVVEDYSRNDYAEEVDRTVLEEAELLNIYKNDPKEFNNTEHSKVLQSVGDDIYKVFVNSLKSGYGIIYSYDEEFGIKFSEIKHDFRLVECMFNVVFNFIERLRFYPENKKNYRSRLHDVSHAIYASYSNKFVSGDRNFVNKLLVAYYFLSVDVDIVYMNYDKKSKSFIFTSIT